jgi:hypothetical protein
MCRGVDGFDDWSQDFTLWSVSPSQGHFQYMSGHLDPCTFQRKQPLLPPPPNAHPTPTPPHNTPPRHNTHPRSRLTSAVEAGCLCIAELHFEVGLPIHVGCIYT